MILKSMSLKSISLMGAVLTCAVVLSGSRVLAEDKKTDKNAKQSSSSSSSGSSLLSNSSTSPNSSRKQPAHHSIISQLSSDDTAADSGESGSRNSGIKSSHTNRLLIDPDNISAVRKHKGVHLGTRTNASKILEQNSHSSGERLSLMQKRRLERMKKQINTHSHGTGSKINSKSSPGTTKGSSDNQPNGARNAAGQQNK